VGRQKGYLNPIPKESKPLQTYHIDHLGVKEITLRKYKYLLVIVDAFTKFTWIYPTKTTSSEEVINNLRKQSAVFGNPERIISDQGTAFTSTAFQEYCAESSIEDHGITTGVPRGNGQVERMNRTIIPMLIKLSLAKPTDWY